MHKQRFFLNQVFTLLGVFIQKGTNCEILNNIYLGIIFMCKIIFQEELDRFLLDHIGNRAE